MENTFLLVVEWYLNLKPVLNLEGCNGIS